MIIMEIPSYDSDNSNNKKVIIIIIVRGALYLSVPWHQYLYTLWGCVRISWHVPRLLYTFYFLYFS